MSRFFIYLFSIFVVALLVPCYSQTSPFVLQVLAQLPLSNFEPSISGASNSTSTTTSGSNAPVLSIHTTDEIHGSSKNILIQEEPVIRKAILSNINDILFMAKGSVKNNITVNVNAKIINQLAGNRISTTQGVDFTKKLVATELSNAINTVAGSKNTTSGLTSVVVIEDQATCGGIASPTSAACAFMISIHG